MTNKWLNELAQVINFNPDWTIEEIKADSNLVSVDIDKATHIVKRYLNEVYPAQAEEIAKNTGDTLYKALRGSEKDYCRMSLATSLMLIKGTLSIDDYMSLMQKDWSAKKFPFPMDAGIEWVNKAREICGELYALKSAPVEPEVTTDDGIFVLPKLDSEGVQRAVDSILSSATKSTTITYDKIKQELDVGLARNVWLLVGKRRLLNGWPLTEKGFFGTRKTTGLLVRKRRWLMTRFTMLPTRSQVT